MLAKLITLGTGEPGAQATLQHDKIAPHDYGKNRVGRKRKNWTIVTIKEFWDEVRETYEEAKGLSNFDPDSPTHDALIRRLAQQYDSKYHLQMEN